MYDKLVVGVLSLYVTAVYSLCVCAKANISNADNMFDLYFPNLPLHHISG